MREAPFKRIEMRTNEDGKSIGVDTGPIPVRELDPVRERLEETTRGADILTVAHDAERVFVPHTPDS